MSKLPLAFEVIKTDFTVSMDDVVSAFVSTYENNLYTRKKDLTVGIRLTEENLEAVDKEVLATITGKEYNQKIDLFDLVAILESSTIQWTDKKDSAKDQVCFSIEIKSSKDQSRSYYNNHITVSRYKAIPKKFSVQRTKVLKSLKSLRAELAETLDSIKAIGRKERQVRGQIALRKLEDAGYDSLMEDPELKQLVQL